MSMGAALSGLQIQVDQDFAGFDDAHPAGADYVIVPAMDDAGDPVITAWLASAAGPVRLRSGLTIEAQPRPPQSPRLPLPPSLKPVRQLDRTLCEIEQRFGAARRGWVMLELEYAGPAEACP